MVNVGHLKVIPAPGSVVSLGLPVRRVNQPLPDIPTAMAEMLRLPCSDIPYGLNPRALANLAFLPSVHLVFCPRDAEVTGRVRNLEPDRIDGSRKASKKARGQSSSVLFSVVCFVTTRPVTGLSGMRVS